jgi:hypothetical protein
MTQMCMQGAAAEMEAAVCEEMLGAAADMLKCVRYQDAHWLAAYSQGRSSKRRSQHIGACSHRLGGAGS